MPFGPVIRVENEAELRRVFRNAQRGKDLTRANRAVAKLVESESRSEAGSGTRQQARAAKTLAARATQKNAQLAIRNTGAVPYGVGAFMGALAHKQFPAWVGASWDLAEGTGPYVIRDVFAHGGIEDIKDEYVREIARTLAEAGLFMED